MISLEMPDGLHDGLQVLFGGGVAHLGQDVLPEKKKLLSYIRKVNMERKIGVRIRRKRKFGNFKQQF